MSGPLPAPGYISNTSRTVSDAQNEWELDIAVAKETLGGASEGATLSITSNTITPVDNYCVYPVDASSGGTINTIAVTNIRDGQVIFLHCVSSSNPITIANRASGSGVSIATFTGSNIVLTNPAMFVALKYSASANIFQEMFPQPNWSSPGPIGSGTASTGTFTSVTLTSTVAAHTWLGNNTSSAAAPSFLAIGIADLPASVVTSSGNLTPLFSSSISGQALSFTLSSASAGTLFGNFSGSSAAPSFNAPGSADQLLGVAHSGIGLEYKSIVAGSNITVTAAAGTITIAASGGSTGTVTSFSAGNAAPFFTTSVSNPSTTPAISFTITAQSANTVCAGPTSGSAAAPTFRALTAADLPSTIVSSVGNLSPLFTSSISSQALSFALSNAAAGSIFGNFTGASAAPTYNSAGSADQLLGVAHTGGGLEYKSILAGANVTVTAAAGSITIASSGSAGSGVNIFYYSYFGGL